MNPCFKRIELIDLILSFRIALPTKCRTNPTKSSEKVRNSMTLKLLRNALERPSYVIWLGREAVLVETRFTFKPLNVLN